MDVFIAYRPSGFFSLQRFSTLNLDVIVSLVLSLHLFIITIKLPLF